MGPKIAKCTAATAAASSSQIIPPSQNQMGSARNQLVKKTKKLRLGPISLHTKFEPNLCTHARAMAVFVRTRPFKLLRSALIKLPSKQKSFLHLLSTFHRKGSSRSEQTYTRCGRVKKKCRKKKMWSKKKKKKKNVKKKKGGKKKKKKKKKS